jgi:structural maintenance of chromosome 2
MVITGGSRNKGASLLSRVHELSEAEDALAEHKRLLGDAEAELKSMEAAAKEHAK